MPFIMMQQPIMPPAIIVHRFCSIAADILSSQVHITRIPPDIFSILMLQRGTIIIPDAIDEEPDMDDMPGIIAPGIDMLAIGIPDPIWPPIIIPRSIIVIVLIAILLNLGQRFRANPGALSN
jgi:hypothetical protein